MTEAMALATTGSGGSWLAGLWLAARFAIGGRAAWTAMSGFLVRGGIVPLILPIVVLPSVIDIAGKHVEPVR